MVSCWRASACKAWVVAANGCKPLASCWPAPNIHGLAVKAGAGLRYGLSDRAALRVTAGHIEARSKAGNRFSANSLSLGFDYLFSLPTW